MIKNHIGSKWHQTLSKKVILLAYISVILFQNIPIMENIYDSEIFGGNSEFFLEKHTKFQNESESSPHSSALSYPLDFSSDYVYFLANEKGYIDSDFYNLWFNGYYHDYSSMTYLSIDDETPIPLSDFTIIQSLLNLTKMANGIFRSDCIAESILQHPSLDVNLKIHIKLYSEQRFYTINYMVWSETIDFFDAELFVFNDLDMDGIDWYYDEIPDEYDDDDAFFDFSTQVIYAYDDDSDNIFGWTSPEDFDDWDVGTPSTLEARISGDSLGNTIQAFSQDIGLTTKQQKLSIEANQTWTVPIVFRFGRNELLYKSVGNVLKNEFVYDFSVLDFSVDLSDQPSVNATILNGGQYTQTRNISIYRNGTYLTSEERELTSGEYINIAFDNLDLIPGEYNEITVSVNNSANDFDNNDNCTQTHMFERTLEFNIKDLDGNVIEGLNVSLFNKETEEHLFSTTSNRNGNISFVDLLANNYTLQASIPEINNSIIYEMDFQYPDLGRYHNIQTNLTTIELQIQDVEGNPVENVSLEFKNNFSSEVIWRTTTNLDGNVTFQYLNGSYDITMAYFDYELQLSLGAIENFSLLEAQNYIQQVNLSTFKFEVINKGSGEPIESADVLIYINPTEHSSGTNIGKVKTDINGNVSIRWSSLVNYSIRIKLSGEFCQINISNSL